MSHQRDLSLIDIMFILAKSEEFLLMSETYIWKFFAQTETQKDICEDANGKLAAGSGNGHEQLFVVLLHRSSVTVMT